MMKFGRKRKDRSISPVVSTKCLTRSRTKSKSPRREKKSFAGNTPKIDTKEKKTSSERKLRSGKIEVCEERFEARKDESPNVQSTRSKVNANKDDKTPQKRKGTPTSSSSNRRVTPKRACKSDRSDSSNFITSAATEDLLRKRKKLHDSNQVRKRLNVQISPLRDEKYSKFAKPSAEEIRKKPSTTDLVKTESPEEKAAVDDHSIDLILLKPETTDEIQKSAFVSESSGTSSECSSIKTQMEPQQPDVAEPAAALSPSPEDRKSDPDPSNDLGDIIDLENEPSTSESVINPCLIIKEEENDFCQEVIVSTEITKYVNRSPILRRKKLRSEVTTEELWEGIQDVRLPRLKKRTADDTEAPSACYSVSQEAKSSPEMDTHRCYLKGYSAEDLAIEPAILPAVHDHAYLSNQPSAMYCHLGIKNGHATPVIAPAREIEQPAADAEHVQMSEPEGSEENKTAQLVDHSILKTILQCSPERDTKRPTDKKSSTSVIISKGTDLQSRDKTTNSKDPTPISKEDNGKSQTFTTKHMKTKDSSNDSIPKDANSDKKYEVKLYITREAGTYRTKESSAPSTSRKPEKRSSGSSVKSSHHKSRTNFYSTRTSRQQSAVRGNNLHRQTTSKDTDELVIVTRAKLRSPGKLGKDTRNSSGNSASLNAGVRKRKLTNSDLLLDRRLAKHACALWSSEQRRRFQQTHPRSTSDELDEVMRNQWDKLTDKERVRYYVRACNALNDRNASVKGKKKPGLGKVVPSKSGSSTNIKPAQFQILSVTQQYELIRRKLTGLQKHFSNKDYQKFLADYAELLKEKKKELKESEDYDEQSLKVELDDIARKTMYEKLLTSERRIEYLKKKREAGAKRRLRAKYKALVCNIIEGRQDGCTFDTESEMLGQLLGDLHSADERPETEDVQETADTEKISKIKADLSNGAPVFEPISYCVEVPGECNKDCSCGDGPQTCYICQLMRDASGGPLVPMETEDVQTVLEEISGVQEDPRLSPSILEQKKLSELMLEEAERLYDEHGERDAGTCDVGYPACVLTSLLVTDKCQRAEEAARIQQVADRYVAACGGRRAVWRQDVRHSGGL